MRLQFKSCLLVLVAALIAGSASAQTRDRAWQFGGEVGAPWDDWSQVNILIDEVAAPGSIQPMELSPDVNIAPIIFDRYPYTHYVEPRDPLWEDGMPRIFRGWGDHNGPSEMRPFSNRVDGDVMTFIAFRRFRKNGNEFYTMDFGGPLPLERFALQMPPPDLLDLIGEPIVNYVPRSGELSGSLSGSTLLLDLRNRGDFYKPMEVILGAVEQNLDAPIEIDFDLDYYRYLRWRTFPEFINPMDNRWTVAKLGYGEFEAFGRGFAGKSRFRTRVVDLTRPAIVGKVDLGVSKWRRVGAQWVETFDEEGTVVGRVWEVGELVEAPNAEAQVQVSVKTGTSADPLNYFTWSDFGALETVDRDTWLSLRARDENDPAFAGYQGPATQDRDRWTPWSGPVLESGTRVALAAGQYFQLQAEFSSERPTDVARLDSVMIELVPLLSPTLVAEVGTFESAAILAEVPLGVPADLTYAVRAAFNGQPLAGFEAVHIATPSRAEFLQLLMGDPLMAVDVPPEDVLIDNTGLTLFLGRRVDDDEQLQIQLRTTLYTLSEKLIGEVFNRNDADLRQRIDEGNATDMIGTDQVLIVATDDISSVIGGIQILPRAFTPNGDGRNDQVLVSYSLFGVVDGAVDVTFFNLAGDRVRRLSAQDQVAGLNPPIFWDGKNESGITVPPGLYVCQIETDTSRGRSARAISVAVAY